MPKIIISNGNALLYNVIYPKPAVYTCIMSLTEHALAIQYAWNT